MENSKHTPTPWRACGANGGRCQCKMIWSEAADIVVSVAIDAGDTNYTAGRGCDLETAKDNAAFIVRACNSHDDLLAALENVVWAYESQHDEDFANAVDWEEVAAAIAKARGE